MAWLRCLSLSMCGLTLFLAMTALSAHGDQPVVRQIAWETNADRAWDASKTTGRPLLLFVTSAGCGYCEQMEQQTYADRGVATTIRQGYIAGRIVAEQQPGLVKRLGLKLYPSTVIISPDAQVLATINGYVEPAVLQQRLAALNKPTMR